VVRYRVELTSTSDQKAAIGAGRRVCWVFAASNDVTPGVHTWVVPAINIQAAADHLQRLIGKSPLTGLCELIWNAIDAEATSVVVAIELTAAGAVDRVRVSDDGHGFTAEEIGDLFSSVGGSWKQHRANRRTRSGLRELHGNKGEGRWKALAIGDRATWESVTADAVGDAKLARLSMTADRPQLAEWEGPSSTTLVRGTKVTITAGMKEPRALLAPTAVGQLCATFALYLSKYPALTIEFNGSTLDPHTLQTRREDIDLTSGSEHGPAVLTIIEWSTEMARELCLCDEHQTTLHQLDASIRAPGFNFTAYISWAGFRVHEHVLALADLASPDVSHVVEEARDKLRTYFRGRRDEEQRSTIEQWRAEEVYPFATEPTEPAGQATQALFNYVAVTASSALNKIDNLEAKRLSLSTIRLALEADPGSLEAVFREVLKLPPEKIEEFHELLQRTSLTAILATSRMVASRLDLLHGLRRLIFDADVRGSVLERAHLHKIVEGAPWIFGEEFATHVSDQSLTTLLRQHLNVMGRTDLVDLPVLDADGADRRIDFMFGRAIELHQNAREHLVVEIKRPTVEIGRAESDQIEDYARAVAKDPRFDQASTKWTFVIVGVDVKDEIVNRVRSSGKPRGLFVDPEGGNFQIWIRKWSEVLGECDHRLKFVRRELAYDPTDDHAMSFLRQTYPDYLPAALR
jgi:Histidine kinase-, DNA gyrase B-, and HSP90-like ATPase